MSKQTSILKEVSVKGIGLHSGKKSKIDFKPAEANTGIQFIRVDLPAKIKIEANWQNAQSSKAVRGTVIAKNGAEIYTIEHILSSANALGIDNLIVEINNSEPPILDGSAKLFAQTLASGGLQELDAERQYFILKEPFVFETDTSKYEVFPSDRLSIDCSISFDHPVLKYQQIAFDLINRDIYLKEIAPAKTFCFDFEIEYLQKNNLALG
ncbi:MAG: UDP-3-O-acyl-N-acetylglucosamine deacetylase, partial [Elusimicrobiota bacterium]|nr:UDP-3-O-acyl-N-acetylglucosamine deacetylase [Elusimicrobiota bacterium]